MLGNGEDPTALPFHYGVLLRTLHEHPSWLLHGSAYTEQLNPPQGYGIVFPWIEVGIAARIAAAQADSGVKFIVLDAAVMLEAGWNKFCDRIVYIHVPPEIRLARLAQQRGWSAKEVQARTQAQLPLTDKVTRADAAIDNSGPPAELARQVAQLVTQWRIPVAS